MDSLNHKVQQTTKHSYSNFAFWDNILQTFDTILIYLLVTLNVIKYNATVNYMYTLIEKIPRTNLTEFNCNDRFCQPKNWIPQQILLNILFKMNFVVRFFISLDCILSFKWLANSEWRTSNNHLTNSIIPFSVFLSFKY